MSDFDALKVVVGDLLERGRIARTIQETLSPTAFEKFLDTVNPKDRPYVLLAMKVQGVVIDWSDADSIVDALSKLGLVVGADSFMRIEGILTEAGIG